MIKKKIISYFINIITIIFISILLSFIFNYPIVKFLIIIGSLYLAWGTLGIISFIDNNGISNLLIRCKNLNRIDMIQENNYKSSNSEVFSRFFTKSKENQIIDYIIPILVGFTLISLEFFFR